MLPLGAVEHEFGCDPHVAGLARALAQPLRAIARFAFVLREVQAVVAPLLSSASTQTNNRDRKGVTQAAR
ncbi:hypothetical protein D3C85_1918260 [compost metagenome]